VTPVVFPSFVFYTPDTPSFHCFLSSTGTAEFLFPVPEFVIHCRVGRLPVNFFTSLTPPPPFTIGICFCKDRVSFSPGGVFCPFFPCFLNKVPPIFPLFSPVSCALERCFWEQSPVDFSCWSLIRFFSARFPLDLFQCEEIFLASWPVLRSTPAGPLRAFSCCLHPL